MEIKVIKAHALENIVKHLHPKTQCIVLDSRELHRGSHMAANCYLGNFFHTVILSSPWDWVYIDTSNNSWTYSWPLKVTDLHSQNFRSVIGCAWCQPRPSLKNPGRTSRTSATEDHSQKMRWTQSPHFRRSESRIVQTRAASCQLNAVPENGMANISIGLISPETLTSLQSL